LDGRVDFVLHSDFIFQSPQCAQPRMSESGDDDSGTHDSFQEAGITKFIGHQQRQVHLRIRKCDVNDTTGKKPEKTEMKLRISVDMFCWMAKDTPSRGRMINRLNTTRVLGNKFTMKDAMDKCHAVLCAPLSRLESMHRVTFPAVVSMLQPKDVPQGLDVATLFINHDTKGIVTLSSFKMPVAFHQLNRISIERVKFNHYAFLDSLKRLRELIIEECDLEEVPSEVETLPNLFLLVLRNNRLLKLPYFLVSIPNLRYIDVCGNSELSDVPVQFGRPGKTPRVDIELPFFSGDKLRLRWKLFACVAHGLVAADSKETSPWIQFLRRGLYDPRILLWIAWFMQPPEPSFGFIW